MRILLILVALERYVPRAPAPLVAVAVGIAASGLFALQTFGVEPVGHIPQGLPSFTAPSLGLIEQLWPGALGIALMSFTESIAAGRAFAKQTDPPIDANRELLATGAANLGGALFGAMPAGGGTSQTAVVRAAGGRTRLAALVTAGVAAATMLLLAPVLGLLPYATLAAVVIVYSVGLIQPAEFIAIRQVRRMEFRWALVACLGVLVFGTLKGIVVAIIISLLGLASQEARPNLYVIGRKRGADVLRPLSPEHPDDETFDGLLILRNGAVVGTVMANLGLEQMLEGLGARLERVPVGDRHVAARMREHDLVLGGEPSGHIVLFGQGSTTGDGLYTALRVLEVAVRRRRPLSEPAAELPNIEEVPQVAVE